VKFPGELGKEEEDNKYVLKRKRKKGQKIRSKQRV
jgi:hypothetical protein